MKMHLRSLILLLAGLAPAALSTYAQEAATEETAKPPVEVELMQKVEDSWSMALAKRDQYGLELVLSPRFVDISADGAVRSRNQEIAYILNKFPDMISLEQKVVSVRLLGDIAVVNGTYILRRRASGGHTVDEKGVFSHVFQKNRSTWQCINAQRTIVVEQAVDGKSTSTAPKQSKAELPFHIPLLHKGDEPAQPAPTSANQPSNQPAPQ
jgi:ketosteroid isomerase-like protein